MKNETDMSSETFLGFAKKEKTHKPNIMTDQLFAHLLRVSRNLPLYKKQFFPTGDFH